jgi:hypothetical protein
MFGLYLEAIALIALPAIYAGGVAAFVWSGLGKPWLFFVFSVLSLYLLYMLVLYVTEPRGSYFLETPKQGGATEQASQMMLVFLGPYIRSMLIFSVLALPLLWLLVKLFRSQA